MVVKNKLKLLTLNQFLPQKKVLTGKKRSVAGRCGVKEVTLLACVNWLQINRGKKLNKETINKYILTLYMCHSNGMCFEFSMKSY